MSPAPLGALLVALALVALAGCSAGYQGKVYDLNRAIAAGQTGDALGLANTALGVDNENQMPGKLDGDVPLLLLERATLLQANGNHEAAVRDFMEADKVLEVLDLSQDDADTVGKYLFSDDASLYQAPPHEKLLVNTMAMISYLAQGDLEGAKVEARRLSVLQKYFKDAAPEERTLFGLGSYLAGFTFERAGQPEEALRYYLEAWRTHGYDLAREPIAYLSRQVGYSDGDVATLLEEVGEVYPPGADEGDVLVIVQNGRAPYKVAERLPIGAFAVSNIHNHRWHMSPEERARADKIVASGALKWINFPVLHAPGEAYERFDLTLGGERVGQPGVLLDVERATVAAWDNDKASLMFAAFTRMITRAIAAEATTAVGKGADLDRALFPGASWLLGRVVEGTLTAADTPDTRSWTTLPATVQIYRVRVPPGAHDVRVTASGPGKRTMREKIEVGGGAFRVVNFRFLRSTAKRPKR